MIKSIRGFVNSTVPYAWDDSLTVYEFLGKILSKLNEVVDEVNLKLPDDFEVAFYEKFREYTKEEMDRIVASGEFETILTSILTGVNEFKDEIIDARQGEVSVGANIKGIKSQLAEFALSSEYGFSPTINDNTIAFQNLLNHCYAVKDLTVYFPQGVYTVKIGNIIKDLTGCKLTIIGDSKHSTIIEYEKTDNSKTAYVNPSSANAIATLVNADEVNISDIHIKGVTSLYNPDGNQGSSVSQYYGSVWGLKIDNSKVVNLENIHVSHFNYRGIAVYKTGHSNINDLHTIVNMINCEGSYNKGSGYWIEDCKELNVNGGEFHHNGQLGVRGTGYGITANKYVVKSFVKGASFHHNYRKGFDTHGCINADILDCNFDSNVLYHISLINSAVYSNENNIIVKNPTLNQTDKSFLTTAYNALIANGFTAAIRPLNISIEGDTSIKNIILDGMTILNSFNGAELLANVSTLSFQIIAPLAELKITNTDINLKDWKVNSTLCYSAFPFRFNVKSIDFFNSRISWQESSKWDGNPGCLFDLPNNLTGELNMVSTVLNLNDCYLIGKMGTAGTSVSVAGMNAGTKRVFENTTINYIERPGASSDRRYFGEMEMLYEKVFTNIGITNGVKKYRINSELLNSEKTIINKRTSAHPADRNMFEIIVEGIITKYVLDIDCYGDTLKIIDGNIITDGTNYTFKSRSEFVDSDGVAKTKFIVSSKTSGNTVTGEIISAKIKSSIFSWGIESINVL